MNDHSSDAGPGERGGEGSALRRLSRIRSTLWLVGFWTLPGLLYSVQIYQLGLRQGIPDFSFLTALAHALPVWWLWVPLTPLLVRFARRFRIRSRGAIKEIAIHLVISVVVALLVAALAGLWFSASAPFADRDRPWAVWTMDLMLSTTLHLYFWCYWLIIAAVHFFDHERRLREQEVAHARLDALAAQSRMQMLANQLRPHFLFNALNGLSTLILKGDTAAAQSMLESLSELLRASLRMGGSRLVPLREELEVAAQYLRVEKMRWGDRLEIRTEVDPLAEGALVPALILQPLLENAVRHGIADSEAGGEVVLVASMVGDRLRIQVENDGMGLAADWEAKTEGRVGLANTRRRLQLLFGDNHELSINELDNGRVRVEVVIPVQEPPNRSDAGRDAVVEEEQAR